MRIIRKERTRKEQGARNEGKGDDDDIDEQKHDEEQEENFTEGVDPVGFPYAENEEEEEHGTRSWEKEGENSNRSVDFDGSRNC